MGHANRILPWIALLAIMGAIPAKAIAQEKPAPAAAQDAQSAEDKETAGAETSKGKESAAAERAYAAGTKSFEAGKTTEAIGSLSTALSSGGLPPQKMAKALYYRGVAYRKEGKPALAISDLTTAVWLKGGLADADRAQAIENRRLAYMEAGLGDSPPPIGAAPLDAPATAKAEAKPAPGNVASAPVQSTSFWDSLFPWGSSSQPTSKQAEPAPSQPPSETAAAAPSPPAQTAADASAPQAPVQDIAAAPTASPAPSPPAAQSVADLTTASLSGGLPGPSPPPAAVPNSSTAETPTLGYSQEPAPAPVSAPASVAESESSTPTTVAGFFNSIFGPIAGTSTSEAPVVTTGATTGAGEPQWSMTTTFSPSEQTAGPPTESLPWAGPQTTAAEKPVAVAEKPAAAEEKPAVSTPVADKTEAKKPAVQKTAAATPVPTSLPPEQMPPSPETATSQQTYSLQVAAVRSREEAEKLVASLKKYQALHNGAVSPAIDETVVGNMGTFYRVRLGPYADATEPGQLCKSLKPQGFDCLVLTQ